MVNLEKQLKVLAIGNSFSEDAMQYLYQVAKDYGVETVTLGNLYIGGCSIHQHVLEIKDKLYDYIYYKNTNGTWEAKDSASILDGLLDEEWDIITLQQVSHQSGLPETYNEELDFLIDFVKSNQRNKAAFLVWHMTWAYQNDSDHGGFIFYENNQSRMYREIVKAVENKILTRKAFEYVIPSGTAIQNLRSSTIGDNLTRDGFHLSYQLGRFTAAMSWFHKISGFKVDNIKYRPEGVSEAELILVKKAVKAAILNPFAITNIR